MNKRKTSKIFENASLMLFFEIFERANCRKAYNKLNLTLLNSLYCPFGLFSSSSQNDENSKVKLLQGKEQIHSCCFILKGLYSKYVKQPQNEDELAENSWFEWLRAIGMSNFQFKFRHQITKMSAEILVFFYPKQHTLQRMVLEI